MNTYYFLATIHFRKTHECWSATSSIPSTPAYRVPRYNSPCAFYKCVSIMGPGSSHAFFRRSIASRIFRLGPKSIPADFKSSSVHQAKAFMSMLSRCIVTVNCSKLSEARKVINGANFGSFV